LNRAVNPPCRPDLQKNLEYRSFALNIPSLFHFILL